MPNEPIVIRDGGEFYLIKPYAHTEVDSPRQSELGGVRIYKHSPETVTLQIRTNGTLHYGGKGRIRPSYSTVDINIQDIDLICRELQRLKTQLVYEPE